MILTPGSQRHLAWCVRSAQWQYLRWLDEEAVKGVIDLGAHVGAYSLMAKMLQPQASVLAVEPEPDTYAILRQNVSWLGIKTLLAALGDGSEFAMSQAGRKDRMDCQYDKKGDCSGDASTVPSYMLSRFAEMMSVEPDKLFWKIDVQGAEFRYVTRNQDALFVLQQSVGFFVELDGGWDTQSAWWLESFPRTHILSWKKSRRGTGIICGRRGNVSVLGPIPFEIQSQPASA